MLRAELERRATVVAPRLLGAVVTSTVGGRPVSVRLTEVEAYEGTDDPASHAFRGPTARNAVMFGPAGHLYVYFVYGMHWCANVVCGPPGVASAVLLRAGEVVDGLETARTRRPAARRDADLARGPARLTQCLGLDRRADGADLLAEPPAAVGLAARAGRRGVVERGRRVGVAAAAERPLRFWLSGDPTVSAYRPAAPRAARRAAANRVAPARENDVP